MRFVSLKTCCFFSFILLLLILISIGILIFILKPQQPKFSLSTIKVNSYKLSVSSNSSLLVSSVVSLILTAQNHNKIGIKYSPSWFYLYYHGIQVGVVKIPGFYQPPHSENVAVTAQISLHSLNVSKIISDDLSLISKGIPMKVLGDVAVQVIFIHITSPKIKVALECDINVNYKDLPFKSYDFLNMDAFQDHLASFPSNYKSSSKKCTLSMYL
ncbi:uncharacterized protein [Euphorbia lathyris]|uniref:uncharacterized protein n=1 Tax=Euphorbia lathyris TaxID=212925 RepID=UPI00331411DC